MPDHCGHIIFAVHSDGAGGERSFACLVGARPVHADIDVARRHLTVGARLRLPVLAQLARTRPDLLNGRSVPLENVFGSAARALIDRMGQEGPDAVIEQLSRFIEGRLATAEPAARFEAAVLASGSVESLADRTGLSVRAAYTRAVETTGLGPKRLLRIVRLHRALALAQEPGATWSAVAYGAGYSDQAHMVREFRSLLGASPEGWRRRGASDSFNTGGDATM